MSKVRSELEEVKVVMHNNVNKIVERDEQLTSLVDKSERLQQGAQKFGTTSRKLRKLMWWQDKKMLLILILVTIAILLIIIIPIIIITQ